MDKYFDTGRKNDFDFFTQHYQEFFTEYGHKFLAIKNKEILGAYDSVMDAITNLQNKYEVGSYIIQECTGNESAYRTTIMRLRIRG